MHIVQIAAECTPLAKVGGLGDVVHGLGKELAKEHKVTVFIPKYKCISNGLSSEEIFYSHFKGESRKNRLWSLKLDNINIKLLEPPNDFFNRDNVYGYEDDVSRFLYFCRAALEYLSQHDNFDIIHVHDWHTSIIPFLIKTAFPKLKTKKSLLTIHNLAYQGVCYETSLKEIGIEEKCDNLLKQGITYADIVNTVSPTYSKEILTPEFGCGLEEILKSKKVHGILNGIDETLWNPENDAAILAPFSNKEPLKSKKRNKLLLQKKLGLKELDVPIVSSISRLVYQKGPKLIKHAIFQTLKRGGQFILLGDGNIEGFKKVRGQLHPLQSTSFNFTYDDTLARQIYASSDFLLIPSIYEPCGLTQLIAFKYGTIPIVRKTGGLADTVSEERGYIFEQKNFKDLNQALDKALKDWKTNPQKIEQMVQKGINLDFSWKNPAKEYIKLYSL